MSLPRRDRRKDIMGAAERLFASRGVHEISLDDVVREAKVGKGTIYRYFSGKDDLFFQTATQGFEELCELLGRMREDGTFEEHLEAACREISGFYGRRRQLFRMMQSEEVRMYWRQGDGRVHWLAERQKLVGAVAGILERGVEEGRVRGDVPVETLATFLLGMLRTGAREGGEVPANGGTIGLVVDLFRRGAGVPDTGFNGIQTTGVRELPAKDVRKDD